MNLRETLDGSISEYFVEYLKSGLTYRFRLQAENSIGLKSAMSTEQYMQAGTLPSAPSIPKIVKQSSEQIHFTWSEPFDNGGAQIVEYEILINKVSTGLKTSRTIINSNEYDFTPEEGMVAGNEYKFKIRSKNFYTHYY